MTKETGSVHGIIIIVAVVALIGVIGFMFWQNFLKGDSTQSVNITDTKNETQNHETPVDVNLNADLTRTASLSLKDKKVTFKYPEGWTVKKVDDSKNAAQSGDARMYIQSPSGDVGVYARIGYGGGFGGACPRSEKKLLSLKVEQIESNAKLRFVETVVRTSYTQADGDKISYYTPAAYIQHLNKETRSVEVGDSGCDFYLTQLFYADGAPYSSRDSTSGEVAVIDNQMIFVSSEQLNEELLLLDSYKTDSEQKSHQLFDDKEYTTAKRIMLTFNFK